MPGHAHVVHEHGIAGQLGGGCRRAGARVPTTRVVVGVLRQACRTSASVSTVRCPANAATPPVRAQPGGRLRRPPRAQRRGMDLDRRARDGGALVRRACGVAPAPWPRGPATGSSSSATDLRQRGSAGRCRDRRGRATQSRWRRPTRPAGSRRPRPGCPRPVPAGRAPGGGAGGVSRTTTNAPTAFRKSARARGASARRVTRRLPGRRCAAPPARPRAGSRDVRATAAQVARQLGTDARFARPARSRASRAAACITMPLRQ